MFTEGTRVRNLETGRIGEVTGNRLDKLVPVVYDDNLRTHYAEDASNLEPTTAMPIGKSTAEQIDKFIDGVQSGKIKTRNCLDMIRFS